MKLATITVQCISPSDEEIEAVIAAWADMKRELQEPRRDSDAEELKMLISRLWTLEVEVT